ncbi:MAG: EamA family transporter [Lachnospiraceae bacterium]|nr:EamA family transporter [Lachnospiraceae bacterium]
MNKRTRGILFALLGGTLWGYSGTVGQYLFSQYEISSEWLTTVRMICAGILLLGFAFARRIPLSPVWRDRREAGRLLLFTVAGLMMVQLTYMKAIYYSNSATATALQFLGQTLVLAVTCLSVRRLPTGREWTAVLLAVGGVFLLSTGGNIHSLALSPQALLWGLGAAVSVMLYTLLPRKLIRSYGSIPITGFGMLIGGTVLCMLTRSWSALPVLDLKGWIYLGVIVFFGTAVAFTLYLQSVSDVGGVTASLLACSEPLAAAIITTVWLKTELVLTDYTAFGMIILMSVLLALPAKSKNVPQ